MWILRRRNRRFQCVRHSNKPEKNMVFWPMNPLYCALYATPIVSNRKKLPSLERPQGRTSERFILTLRRYGLNI
jgi:hypothetical protein